MSIIPIVEIHLGRNDRKFTVISYAHHSSLGLSVPSGDFNTFGWEEFKVIGFRVIVKSLSDYHSAYNERPSQFQKMSVSERSQFFKENLSLLISERSNNLWWIDPMEPVDDGAAVLPIGPRRRVSFRPAEEGDSFVGVVLKALSIEN